MLHCCTVGYEVVVELKNDTQIKGILEATDGNMNLVLNDATQTSCRQSSEDCVHLVSAHINGPSIRYIMFPKSIRANSHLQQYVRRLDYLQSRTQPRQIIDRKKKVDEDDEA